MEGRSGYSDDYGDDFPGQMDLYRSNVVRAVRGKRGRRFLEELRDALDALPKKRLVPNDLETEDGDVCTLGAALRKRNVDGETITGEDHKKLAKLFGVSEMLIAEIEFRNDETGPYEPEKKWEFMRELVDKWLADPSAAW